MTIDQAKSILPKKPLEPLRGELGVAHGVRDISVAEVLLDRTRALAIAGSAQSGRIDMNAVGPMTRELAIPKRGLEVLVEEELHKA
jgi:hypothetical protein